MLQSFCRINNVYAGITMLQTDVVSVMTKEEKVVGVEIANDEVHTLIRCKHVIAGDEYPLEVGGKPVEMAGNVVHGVYVVRGDNKGGEGDNKGEGEKKELREIVVVPATSEHRAVYALVVGVA